MNIVLCCDFRPLSLPFPFVIFEGFLLAFFSLSFLTLRKSYHVNKLSWTHCCQCPGRINSYEGKKVVFSFFFFSGQHKFLCCVLSCLSCSTRKKKRERTEPFWLHSTARCMAKVAHVCRRSERKHRQCGSDDDDILIPRILVIVRAFVASSNLHSRLEEHMNAVEPVHHLGQRKETATTTEQRVSSHRETQFLW